MISREGIKQEYEQFSFKHPYVMSIGEAALLFGVKHGLQKVGEKAGVPLGHGRRDSKTRNKVIEEHPVMAATAATVWAPVSEELLFRELPARILERKGYGKESATSRAAKLGVATLFAAAHAGPDAIPLPQLLGGIHYAAVHEKRGLGPSIAAHATHNVLQATRHLIASKKQ